MGSHKYFKGVIVTKFRYEVVVWSSDIGAKSHGAFARKLDAENAAKKYKASEEFAAVYDYKTNSAFVVFGYADPFSETVSVYYKRNGKYVLLREGIEQ